MVLENKTSYDNRCDHGNGIQDAAQPLPSLAVRGS